MRHSRLNLYELVWTGMLWKCLELGCKVTRIVALLSLYARLHLDHLTQTHRLEQTR